MIPEDFKDFFLSSSASAQSEIVSMLLSISTGDSNLVVDLLHLTGRLDKIYSVT